MIVGMPRRMAQPQGGASIDRGNPITAGLVFAYLPGLTVDLVSGVAAAGFGPNSSPVGTSLKTIAAAGTNGLNIGAGSILGGLNASTVAAVFTPTSTANAALYCERSATVGTAIYKLEINALVPNRPQFTYRNSGNVILQLTGNGNDHRVNEPRFFAARKNGTAHDVYSGAFKTSGTFGSASTTFNDSGLSRAISFDPNDINARANGVSHLVAGWSRALSDAEIASLSANPWQIFSPTPRLPLAFQTSISITRPNSDITVAGWTSTGADYFSPLADASDATFDTSPDVTAPTPLVVGLDSSLAAGTYDITVRALRTGTTGRVRVLLLDGSGATVGTSSFQALTGSFGDYVLTVTTTGTATRAQIEVTT